MSLIQPKLSLPNTQYNQDPQLLDPNEYQRNRESVKSPAEQNYFEDEFFIKYSTKQCILHHPLDIKNALFYRILLAMVFDSIGTLIFYFCSMVLITLSS